MTRIINQLSNLQKLSVIRKKDREIKNIECIYKWTTTLLASVNGKRKIVEWLKEAVAEGKSSLDRSGLPTVVVVWLVEPTQLANGADPLVHLLLSLSYEIKSAIWGLDVKHEAVLELLPLKGQASVHLLAAVQVDDPNGFLGVVVLVVLQNIRVATHAAAAEYEPALLPCLGRKQIERWEKNHNVRKREAVVLWASVAKTYVSSQWMINLYFNFFFLLLCKQRRYHLHLK